MNKLFYLLSEDEAVDGTRLRRTLCDRVVPALRDSNATEISVFASDGDVAAGSPIRQSNPPIRAALSCFLDDLVDRTSVETLLGEIVSDVAGYWVRESRPMSHARQSGQRTPGIKQLSCIRQRDDISHAEFLRIWREDHEAVALETQSTFGYVRNEILRPLAPESPTPWTAIVEESFPIEALDDTMVFFGARTPAERDANMKRMVESCQRFLDLNRIEVTFMSEYYFD